MFVSNCERIEVTFKASDKLHNSSDFRQRTGPNLETDFTIVWDDGKRVGAQKEEQINHIGYFVLSICDSAGVKKKKKVTRLLHTRVSQFVKKLELDFVNKIVQKMQCTGCLTKQFPLCLFFIFSAS